MEAFFVSLRNSRFCQGRKTFTMFLNLSWPALSAEARPGNMLVLIFVLVLVLHIGFISWLLTPASQKLTPAQTVMQVSMVSVSAPQPSSAPAAVTPPEKKPEPKKPEVKPVVKKVNPVVKKTPEPTPAPAQNVAEPQPAAAEAAPSQAQTSPAAEASAAPSVKTEQYTEANYRADYLNNPKPVYPMVAKSRGWQGKVMLRVLISAAGISAKVEIERSSGHEILDDAAVETVKTWKFVPAKHGDTAVDDWALIPIVFSLSD